MGIGAAHDIEPWIGPRGARRPARRRRSSSRSPRRSTPPRASQTSLADDRRPLLRDLGRRAPPAAGAAQHAVAQLRPRRASCWTRRRRGSARSGRRSAIAYDRLRRRLDSLVGSELGGALQEPIVTMRNGRYVVPVRADARGRVKGIVHDASGSGQTLFVEPLVVVELGNAWREAQAAVEEEVGRILDELSALVGANATMLARDARGARAVRLLDGEGAAGRGAWTAIRPAPAARRGGRAALGAPPGAHRPRRADRHPARRRLHGARHHGPQHGRQDGRAADARAARPHAPGRAPRPGRGGLRAARCSATSSPTSATSSRSRSRCRRSRATCARSSGSSSAPGPGTLVLLDELGAGTDPTEGSALAQALLDHFIRSGALVAATTHYAEIKVYAHETPAARNASVEFDLETLSPTYRLTIGLPGRLAGVRDRGAARAARRDRRRRARAG